MSKFIIFIFGGLFALFSLVESSVGSTNDIDLLYISLNGNSQISSLEFISRWKGGAEAYILPGKSPKIKLACLANQIIYWKNDDTLEIYAKNITTYSTKLNNEEFKNSEFIEFSIPSNSKSFNATLHCFYYLTPNKVKFKYIWINKTENGYLIFSESIDKIREDEICMDFCQLTVNYGKLQKEIKEKKAFLYCSENVLEFKPKFINTNCTNWNECKTAFTKKNCTTCSKIQKSRLEYPPVSFEYQIENYLDSGQNFEYCNNTEEKTEPLALFIPIFEYICILTWKMRENQDFEKFKNLLRIKAQEVKDELGFVIKCIGPSFFFKQNIDVEIKITKYYKDNNGIVLNQTGISNKNQNGYVKYQSKVNLKNNFIIDYKLYMKIKCTASLWSPKTKFSVFKILEISAIPELIKHNEVQNVIQEFGENNDLKCFYFLCFINNKLSVQTAPDFCLNTSKTTEIYKVKSLFCQIKICPIKSSNITYYVLAGICVFILILIIGIIFLIKRIRRLKSEVVLSKRECQKFIQGQVSGSFKTENNANKATLLPYNNNFEIPLSNLNLSDECEVLGNGQFGKVLKTKYKGDIVAVKTFKRNTSPIFLKSFLDELKIMCFVGKHENILNLIGANTANIRKGDLILVLEYCSNGNLVTFLRLHRESFVNFLEGRKFKLPRITSVFYMAPETSSVISSINLVQWSHNIAKGMEFLSEKKVVHCDLAGRNILLTDNLVAKVCDFGLSKQLFAEYSVYIQRSTIPLPLKWMAIESLQDMEFSTQSDIWSFGIVLWEIFTLGQSPYPGQDWGFESYQILKDGYRMNDPDFANQDICQKMMECWNINPLERPSFQDLAEFFRIEHKKITKKSSWFTS